MGPAAIAADALFRQNGSLAQLSPTTIAALTALAPLEVPDNPVAMRDDVMPKVFAQALRLLLDDKGVDVVITLHVPMVGAPAPETAAAVLDVIKAVRVHE